MTSDYWNTQGGYRLTIIPLCRTDNTFPALRYIVIIMVLLALSHMASLITYPESEKDVQSTCPSGLANALHLSGFIDQFLWTETKIESPQY
jgi:hypothetical protein